MDEVVGVLQVLLLDEMVGMPQVFQLDKVVGVPQVLQEGEMFEGLLVLLRWWVMVYLDV